MTTINKYGFPLLFSFMLICSGVFAQSTGNSADAILGVFISKDGSKVQVYQQDTQYFGKIIGLTNGNGKAEVGTILLKNLVYASGNWTGMIYAPGRDQDFPVTITLPDLATMDLKVKAGMVSRGFQWKRVQQ